MTTENEIVDKSSGKESQSAYYFSCPSCGNNARFYAVHEQADGDTGCLIFLLGGFLSWLLFLNSRSARVQCAQCGVIFRLPPFSSSPVSTAIFWLVMLVSAGGIIGFVLGLAGGIQMWAANDPLIQSLKKFAAENSLSFTLSAAAALVLFFAGSFVIAIIADARHRSNIRKNYAYRPTERDCSADE